MSPYNPRKKAQAIDLAHRMAILCQSDEEICRQTNLSPGDVKSLQRTKFFKTAYEEALHRMNEKTIDKAVSVNFGAMEVQLRIRKAEAWEAYKRIVNLSKDASNESVQLKANMWVAAAGGLQELAEDSKDPPPTIILSPEAMRIVEEKMKEAAELPEGEHGAITSTGN